MIEKFHVSRIACYTLATSLLLIACSQEAQPPQQQVKNNRTEAATPAATEATAADVIARVGDQDIHFSEINTMLNSSAVVGLSIPALGTPQRDTVRIALLDKVVSANLIYLDALAKGVDKDAGYQRTMQRYSNAILADLYLRKSLLGDMSPSEDQLQAYIDEVTLPGKEVTDELRRVLEANLRKRNLMQRQAEIQDELRNGVEIRIHASNIYAEGESERADDAPVAEVGSETITWGEVRNQLIAAGKGAVAKDPLAMESEARLQYLQSEIDTRLMAQKARAAGLEQDPTFLARFNEYRKTSLINLHRANLVEDMRPDEAGLKAYYEANRDKIATPEYRKVQMVMLNSEKEATSVKEEIEAGKITMYQAASEHSVAPDAKQNLGEIGWVPQGKLKPELDSVVFSLEPAEIGGPVQAGGLWHIVSVLDVKDAQNADISDARAQKLALRTYIHEKLDEYVVNLRKNDFKVEVYEDVMIALAQQEADMVKEMSERARQAGSETVRRIKEYQELIGVEAQTPDS